MKEAEERIYRNAASVREAPVKEPKQAHIQVAIDFANDMMNRFEPDELNEITHQVKDIFLQRRESELETLRQRVSYLEKSLETL